MSTQEVKVNFTSDSNGLTFPEGQWLTIEIDNAEVVTAALWSGKNLVIVGQSDSYTLKMKVKRYFMDLKGSAMLNVHYWKDNRWNGVEFNFRII